jgi:hypothetical protein
MEPSQPAAWRENFGLQIIARSKGCDNGKDAKGGPTTNGLIGQDHARRGQGNGFLSIVVNRNGRVWTMLLYVVLECQGESFAALFLNGVGIVHVSLLHVGVVFWKWLRQNANATCLARNVPHLTVKRPKAITG